MGLPAFLIFVLVIIGIFILLLATYFLFVLLAKIFKWKIKKEE
jgi:hypothetical protein